MNLRWIFALAMITTLIGIVACERDDDEPFINRDFSRLYISFSDYSTNPQVASPTNIGVIKRADSTNFADVNNFQPFQSRTFGGNAISFSPAAQRVFLSSINQVVSDTSIQIFMVGPEGNLANDGKIDNKHANKVTGLVYYPSVDVLFGIDVSSSTIISYDIPKNRKDYMKVSRRFIIEDELLPWALAIHNNIMYVSRNGTNGGVDIYEGLISRRTDTLYNDVKPTRSLRIADTHNIQGMSLDTVNNTLALTDYTTSGTTSTGRILLFENFSELAKNGGNITPTRIITGPNTGLIRPSDVALDFKENSKYLYVADPGAKKVYRFLKTAEGDSKPDSEFSYRNGASTPVGLSLDSR